MDRGLIRGRVSNVQQRMEIAPTANTASTVVWNFRLQRAGPDGAQLPAVSVEMRGVGFEGSILEGDEVEVVARGYKSGDVIATREVRNLTSNSRVRARRRLWFIG
jgi:hypothetical protein